jgi:hypothetical protein
MNPDADTIEEDGTLADSLRENAQLAQYEAEESARLQKQAYMRAGVLRRKKADTTSGKLGLATFGLMLLVAVLFDTVKVLINLIPFVGGVLEDFTIAPLATFVFFIWLKMHGINFTKGPRGFFFLLTIVLNFVPILNALPEWTSFVVGLYLSESKISTSMQKSLKKVRGK